MNNNRITVRWDKNRKTYVAQGADKILGGVQASGSSPEIAEERARFLMNPRGRKKNIYFDRKSMGFKLGSKPKRGRRKHTPREKQARGQFEQFQREAKQETKARELAKKDEALWRELYGSQNPARVFPGNLTDSERRALLKLVRRAHMATKKRKRRKKKNGKMPPGLAAYWRKKRARKAKRRNPKTRVTAAGIAGQVAKLAHKQRPDIPMALLLRHAKKAVRAYGPARAVKQYRKESGNPRHRRRTRRANPVRKRVKVIKAPRGMTGKALRAFARAKAAEYGAPSRIIGR